MKFKFFVVELKVIDSFPNSFVIFDFQLVFFWGWRAPPPQPPPQPQPQAQPQQQRSVSHKSALLFACTW